MFDNELGGLDVVGLDAADTLAAAETNEHALIAAETRRLQIAAHWADPHAGDAVPKRRLPSSERAVRLGGKALRRSAISWRRSLGVCCACRTAPRRG